MDKFKPLHYVTQLKFSSDFGVMYEISRNNMNHISLIAFTFLTITIALSGCVRTMQVYDGTARTRSEISILRPNWYLTIIYLDGKFIQSQATMKPSWDNPLGAAYNAIAILPGQHTVTLEYHKGASLYTLTPYPITSRIEICFNSKAGHSYTAY